MIHGAVLDSTGWFEFDKHAIGRSKNVPVNITGNQNYAYAA